MRAFHWTIIICLRCCLPLELIEVRDSRWAQYFLCFSVRCLPLTPIGVFLNLKINIILILKQTERGRSVKLRILKQFWYLEITKENTLQPLKLNKRHLDIWLSLKWINKCQINQWNTLLKYVDDLNVAVSINFHYSRIFLLWSWFSSN